MTASYRHDGFLSTELARGSVIILMYLNITTLFFREFTWNVIFVLQHYSVTITNVVVFKKIF